jgi:hypothetical protein
MTLQRLDEAQAIIAKGQPAHIIDVLVYTDAVVTVAREKRAIAVARKAARTRINAARRMGEIILAAEDPEPLWQLLPSRFGACDDLALIPKKSFEKVVDDMIALDRACTIRSVLRRARRQSLRRVEDGIFIDYSGCYWIKPKQRGSGPPSPVPIGGIDEARRRLGLRSHRGATRLDEAYSQARILSSTLSHLRTVVTGDANNLVGEAELAQMRVSELLDQAIKAALQ